MPSWKSGKERRSPRSETKRRSPRERGEVRWRNIQRTTRVRSTSRSSGSREGAEDSGGMPPTTRTYVGYLRRRAESPPKHRHQSSRIKMLDSKRDDVAPRPVGMGRGAHRRMIPPHSHTHTLHTKGRRPASGGRAQAKVHGLNLRRSDLPCVGPAGRSPLRDFHAFLEVRERTEVAALGDQTTIAARTRRSALEKYPADDASTKHVAIERVARRRGGLRRDATHDSDLRRLPPTTSRVATQAPPPE